MAGRRCGQKEGWANRATTQVQRYAHSPQTTHAAPYRFGVDSVIRVCHLLFSTRAHCAKTAGLGADASLHYLPVPAPPSTHHCLQCS